MSILAAQLGGADAREFVVGALRAAPGRLDGEPMIVEHTGFVLGAGRTRIEAADDEGASVVVDSARAVSLLWDGRLDNPEELAAALGADRGTPDSRLLIEAWLAWGQDCLRRVKGDYAFVLVDSRRRAAFVGRDRMSVRNIYWAQEQGCVRFASEACLLTRGRVAPDETSLVRFAAGRPYERDRTLYAGVRPVTAATQLSIDLSSLQPRTTAYWTPDPWREDARPASEHAAELRHALREAVRRRTRHITAGVMASGGLDSSSVAAAAAAVAREDARPLPFLFSFVSKGLPSDESYYQEALARFLGVDRDVIEPPTRGYVPEAFPEMDLFHTSYVPNDVLASRAKERGIRVLLTGDGSDELQPRTRQELESAVRRHKPLDALHYAGLVDDPLDPSRWRGLGRALLTTLLLDDARDRRRAKRSARGPSWFTRRAQELLADADASMRKELEIYKHPDRAKTVVCSVLTHGIPHSYSRPSNQTFFARRGIELRYPFLDLDVVDLLLAVPPRERFRYELLKPLLREAMAADMPPAVTWRRFPSEYSAFFEAAIMAEAPRWQALTACTRLADLGLVNPDTFRSALNNWGASALCRWDVDGTLTSEAWLTRQP